MTKLEQLINEYCPNGVEFKKIKEIYKRIKGTPITAGKMKEIENPAGDIRVFAGGKTVINAFEEDIPNANITRVPAVLVQSRGVIDAVYYDKPFTFKNEMWAYTAENPIAVKFLYYVLKNNVQQFRDVASGMGALPQISLPVTEEFVMPVPPIEVQREIVRILDNFTELTAELTAEFTARKQQYEYYRDSILSFDNVKFVKIGDIAKLCAGATPSTTKNEYWENGTIPWMSSGEVNNKIVLNTEKFITKLGYENSSTKLLPKNTVVIALAGQGKTRGKVAITKIELCTNQSLCGIIVNDKVNSKYLYYYLESQYATLRSISSGDGNRGGLNLSMIGNFTIPLPSLEEQQRIVDILDKFDTYCNDLTQGLPAEIELRKQQYEYYRDKLLYFKELK